jgi:adenine-specific DNA-methyltransferase
MPTLNWIGKEAVVNHHNQVPFRTLDKKYTFGGDESENKIIHGDNLEALKALLPEYEGRIKFIYIDPPYNTGASPEDGGWKYYDNVDSPRIRKWLGQVVGKEAEDLSRHDKWLCMMYPRLILLQKLLSEDGAIFISIDDNELANLKTICDEIFGAGNYCGIWHWYRSATPPALSKKIKKNLEYVLCYEKSKTPEYYRGVKKESKSNDPITKKQNNISELYFAPKTLHFKTEKANWKIGTYGTAKYPNELLDDLEVENFVNKNGVRFRNRFTWSQSYLEEQLKQETRIDCSKDLVISYKKKEYENEIPRNLIDKEVSVDTTEEAGKILTNIFGKEDVFTFPKHPSLIEYLLQFREDKNAIILDSFAGSGTTAHAVLNLNKQDEGNRKFILVEMEDFAEDLTAERVKKVIKGYNAKKEVELYSKKLQIKNIKDWSSYNDEIEEIKKEHKNDYVEFTKEVEYNTLKLKGTTNGITEGTGGSFSYYELGEPIFNEDGYLNESVGTEKLREYVWYTETRVPYVGLSYNGSRQNEPKNGCHTVTALRYLLGNHNGTAYYFYYEPDRITTLSHNTLNIVCEKAETYVIYADQCVIDDEWLAANNIIFKKIPRDIRNF